MFNVGDLVRSKKKADGKEIYRLTNSAVVCEVIMVDLWNESMRVRPLWTEGEFWVDPRNFQLEEAIALENE